MIHDIIPGFLILPTFQGHRGQSLTQLNYEVDVFCNYLTWKFLTLHERVSRHHLRFYQISAQATWWPSWKSN
jgi:hypothetical protein